MNKINLFFEGIAKFAGRKIYGVAITPTRTKDHKDKDKINMPGVHVYLPEYLKAAAPTLEGKPILLDHDPNKVIGKVTVAKWDEAANGIVYEGTITVEYAEKVANGEIRNVSVCANPWVEGGGVLWKDGFAPFNFVFDELSLIDPRIMEPGDVNAWVKLEEAIAKSKEEELVEQLQHQVPDKLLKNPPEKSLEELRQDAADMKDIIRLANEITATKERMAQESEQHDAETTENNPEATEETVKTETPLERFARRLKK